MDAERFSMRMTLPHPLFGELFCYSGSFTLGGESAALWSAPEAVATSFPLSAKSSPFYRWATINWKR